jgi:hypothetical protein
LQAILVVVDRSRYIDREHELDVDGRIVGTRCAGQQRRRRQREQKSNGHDDVALRRSPLGERRPANFVASLRICP